MGRVDVRRAVQIGDGARHAQQPVVTAGREAQTLKRALEQLKGIVPDYHADLTKEGRLINDPWPTPGGSSGFDLAGVAVLNQKVEAVEMADGISLSVYPNPASERVSIVMNGSESTDAILFDINGRAVTTMTLHEGLNTVEISDLPQGVYMLRANGAVHKIIKK